MTVILMPEVLRQKLGDDGAKEFVNLLNESLKNGWLRQNPKLFAGCSGSG